MKIAAVTDDGETISLHFGRAQRYAVYAVENGQIIGHELRDKVSHHHAAHAHDHSQHERGGEAEHNPMLASIMDCEALLARGMGRGAYLALQEANIKPIVTDIAAVEDAVRAYIQGDIVDHTEKMH